MTVGTTWWEVCPDCGGRDPSRWFCDTCGHQGGWEEDERSQARRETEDLKAQLVRNLLSLMARCYR